MEELTINCDGQCKQRKKISELMILNLKKDAKSKFSKTFNELYICKDCLKTAKPLTLKHFEEY